MNLLLLTIWWLTGKHQTLVECQYRIVGGFHSTQGKWPFIVSIGSNNLHFCGGTILDERTIITASHCFHDQDGEMITENTTVHVGEINISEADRKYLFDVDQIIIHPLYKFGNNFNDVAIMKLSRPIPPDLKDVSSMMLPNLNTEIDFNNCFVMGWGNEKFDYPETSIIMKEIRVNITEQEYCKSVETTRFDEDSMLCILYKGSESSCQGDSGGPVVCALVSDPNQFVIEGITSYSTRCDLLKSPGYFIMVRAYLDWIDQYTETNGDTMSSKSSSMRSSTSLKSFLLFMSMMAMLNTLS